MNHTPTLFRVTIEVGDLDAATELYRDLLQFGWSTLRPGAMSEDDAAFIADRLWERGWRQAGANQASQDEHSGPDSAGG